MEKPDLRGKVPESWACIDCGINTAPGPLTPGRTKQIDPQIYFAQVIPAFNGFNAAQVTPAGWLVERWKVQPGQMCHKASTRNRSRQDLMPQPDDYDPDDPEDVWDHVQETIVNAVESGDLETPQLYAAIAVRLLPEFPKLRAVQLALEVFIGQHGDANEYLTDASIENAATS
jgi:hypothetical protein